MKTDLNIRPMTPQEKIYAGLQSSQISVFQSFHTLCKPVFRFLL